MKGILLHRLRYHKGHGTMNDFILFADPEGFRTMNPESIQRLADRRAGIGADGVIRAVRAGVMEEWEGDPNLWFMDCYNADGSVAEICGNGLLVFGIYLLQQQLAHSIELDIATRAGLRHVSIGHNSVAAGLGDARVTGDIVQVQVGDASWEATVIDVGTPHAVSFVESGTLDELRLEEPPIWEPASRFPNGTNLEFIEVVDDNNLNMRVFGRGSGETMSCGTGAVAAAAAHRARTGALGAIHVTVPGGTLRVDFDGDAATLTGPAVIVADGTVWL